MFSVSETKYQTYSHRDFCIKKQFNLLEAKISSFMSQSDKIRNSRTTLVPYEERLYYIRYIHPTILRTYLFSSL